MSLARRSLTVFFTALVAGSGATGTASAVPGPGPGPTPQASAQDAPPCRNYLVPTPWGRFTNDVRPRGDDPIGTVSWALFINDPADVPGVYNFQEFVNGKPISNLKTQTKTDNIHQVFYRAENGITRYNSGDKIHVNVDHEANGHIYFTPLNLCTVP